MYRAGGLAFVTTKEGKHKSWDMKFYLLTLSSSNARDCILFFLLKMFTNLNLFATGLLRGK